ncbi:nitrilase family protein [Sedimentibacter sp. MB31-C6]|uniref:nitrilase family protein n=1 Tax=Sedimentibacter sp. MB31-C6 TaxID=3109366 RepID=UPI002DDD0CC9|nr:nitrilase family protein [Sedimentibacter sp. MB36-C1]WSI02936.1 nitrilase family protein [Sedimentibacter sp. MB36-C1]
MSDKIVKRKSLEVKVACLQMDIKIGDTENNIKKSVRMINEAADNKAVLIVLPEMANSGYAFDNREEAIALAEDIQDSISVKSWIKVAHDRNVYIVSGITEIDGVDLYNTAVLIGPNGLIGKYRKLHLWEEEFLWFEQGNLGLPVFHTPIGRIGMIICYDMWFPETYRILAAQGTDIICIPTNWTNNETLPNNMKNFGPILAMAAAHSSGIYIAAADRVGTEREMVFPGRSLIVKTSGISIAGPADDTEQIIYGDCNFARTRAHGQNKYNSTKKDRRLDIYDEFLGYK